jgi:hypothetical protein
MAPLRRDRPPPSHPYNLHNKPGRIQNPISYMLFLQHIDQFVLVGASVACSTSYAKIEERSKCSFGALGYLSHTISTIVTMDKAKVHVNPSWPKPKTVRAVRGFLGLTGH